MSATATHLIEDIRPTVPLRQWVLTFPYPRRARLAHDGKLLSALTRLFVDTVQSFYAPRDDEKTGAITVVQRTSSDLRVNPHLHVVLLDGAARGDARQGRRRRGAREAPPLRARGAYRPWAELMKRTFGIDVLQCPKCKARMELLSVVTDPKSISRRTLLLARKERRLTGPR